ncbi:MAG: isoleucine--tRNA ligase [Bryobacteraceae bacterium]|nr:isoleucine--tRNA ligase [Bryobacteraceae bacterium]MDW8378162.1 isoleucine--tRNA ligase [Bryobacterales bacterium]
MPAKQVDLKKTVNLPSTNFPMKANLPQTEPKILARWNESGLYYRIRQASAGRPRYVLHDGPPYANGRIHLGTAFNKILKDFIVKSKTMAGFDSPYVPGWDCHGLPIEIKVDAELGPKKKHMSPVEIRRACRKYAEKFVHLQREDFERLGVFGRWEDPYLTMSAHYQAQIAAAFVDFLHQGYVYKGLKPVNWCIHCRTALAEAEVEYEPHVSPSIWVRFELLSDPARIDPTLAGKKVYGLIWTTTPWTLPANLAIAFNPRFDYVAVEVSSDVYLVARDLLKDTAEKCGWASPAQICLVKGQQLEGLEFQHPFLARVSKGILADHVTLEQGTGAVHTAPGHGQEDYVSGQQYGLPTYCPVDAQGAFFEPHGAPGEIPPELLGKIVWDANPVVIRILAERGALLAEKRVDHSYPHCWRCHHPTIFRATEQWFIGMDRNNLRERALEAIRNVKWMPAWGQERISNMIATRPDWCISRQRTWGVPIIVFYCESCGEKLTDRHVLDHVVALFAQHTADIWYEKSAAELIPSGVRCASCGHDQFRKETDILDVWFDSGSSHLAVLHEGNQLPWPSDLYLEGGDQYRGWFHSSLLVGTALRGRAPYRECATHGWALDGEGRAMSKSLGNVILPEDVIKQYGAEVLRLWASSVEFQEDVRVSETILARLTEAYRKIRNTFRFALGNLFDFDPTLDLLSPQAQLEFDQWILLRCEQVIERCRKYYEDFAFHRVYQALYNFATTDLSAVYFDVIKDRLYTAAPRSQLRRSAQSSLYKVTHALVRLLAPLLSFTTEEVWGHLRKLPGDPDSVHLTLFPEPNFPTLGLTAEDRARLVNWDRLLAVREQVLKSLEVARQEKFIGAPLEAKVRLQAGQNLFPLLDRYQQTLPALFIVSQVALEDHASAELAVHVERADGLKCERCWKYSMDIGFDPEFPTVCLACAEALKEILG